jgi:acyl-coenzyme A synthetase/AMP-(fatty) acid ligase
MARIAERDHRVAIDESVVPNALHFSANFNVAVTFIDRHLDEGRGQRTALRHQGGAVSYAQLAENVGRAGNALLSLGIAPGERLIMAAFDEPIFFYVFWGAIKAGIIPIAVSTFLKTAEYRFLASDAACSAFVYSSALAAEAVGVAGASSQLRVVLPIDGPGSLAERMATASPVLPPHPATATSECFWLYSSGSTGTPKGVVHRHRDMVVTSERYGRKTAGLTADDVGAE